MPGGLPDEPTAFGALATELLAAKAFEEGDIEYARTKFNELRFLANVPEGVMQRATQALAALPAVTIADPLATPETEASPALPVPAGEETPE